MKGKEGIDGDILQKHIEAFIPNKGIPVKELGSGIQSRQTDAINPLGMFSLSPHPIMMPRLMKMLYGFDSGIRKMWPYIDGSMKYLLGSRGLSKSTSFIILQYFHNLRIPYVIKNGLP